jgi:hypothetical protein
MSDKYCNKSPKIVAELQSWRIKNSFGVHDDILHAAALVTPCYQKGGYG